MEKKSKNKKGRAKKGWTPLHTAAQNGNLEDCQSILKTEVEKNPKEKDGWTPLHSAAQNGHFDVFKLILENVDDKNPMDEYGITPLDEADEMKQRKICQLIAKMIGYNQTEFDYDRNEGRLHYLTKEARCNLTNFYEMVKRKSAGKSVNQNNLIMFL